ncbi:MAG: DsbC/DsbD-like thiol-disulfide interchange protein [Paracoccaceae bacterium]|jgi:DsbC/DsbD-like thiol-disulfide interchange protein
MRAFLILTLLITPVWAHDSQLEGPGLSIDLISENRSVTEGQPFTVGLQIHHFAGFHTYWKNPGMVGMETSIEWTLPDGFTASEISWPYPQNTFMSEYPCHGYERDVTLLVTITPPTKINASAVTLSAKSRWLACAKGCFPGYQTFQMTLPVTAEPVRDTTAKAHIQKATSELPNTKHKVKATLLSDPDAPVIKVLFEGVGKISVESLYFFSNDRQISSDKKQEFTHQNDGSILLAVPRSEYSPKGATTLPGVLKLGQRHLAIEAGTKN